MIEKPDIIHKERSIGRMRLVCMKHKLFLVFILAVILLCLFGCGKKEEVSEQTDIQKATEGAESIKQGTIKIGCGAPITGDSAQFGVMLKKGIELGLEEINGAGGVDGKTIEVIYGDDCSQPQEAVAVAQKFAGDKDIVAVIGHFNSICSIPSRSVYDEAGLLEFSPASTNADFAKGSKWAFRNIFNDRFQGQSIARYIKNQLKLKKVAVFYDNDDYGAPLKDFFVAEAKKLGLEVVGTEAYEKDTIDFSPQLTKIKGLNPDIIFISGLYSHAGRIVAKARELGIATQFIGSDGLFSSDFIALAGKAAEGTIISCPFLSQLGGEKGKEFSDKFQEKYGEVPDAWAVLSYDALNMIVDTIRSVGTDRTAIRDAFAKIDSPEKAYKGVGGPIYFDENGDCKKPIHMATVKNGQFVPAPIQMPVESD